RQGTTLTTVETRRESRRTLDQGRQRVHRVCCSGDQKRERKGGRERDNRRERSLIERDGGSKNPGEGIIRPSRHVPSLRCPAVPIERKSEREREKKKEGQIRRSRKKERERGSVRKRAKRSRSDSLPVAIDGQQRDEEPCVAKECVAPVADRGGWPGDSIRGKFF
ncbi:hypothetical protein ALC62_15573, partial [Cyphomyrmex costatus]